MNDTLTIKDGRNVLRLERRFAHAPEKVWRAVIEPERLSAWYPGTVSLLEPRVGGRMALDYGDGWTTTAVVTAIDPPRLFAFTESSLDEMPREGDGHIRIELRPDGDGCLMIFSQTFDDRPNAAGYASGWQGCLDALDAALGGKPIEQPNLAVQRHEFYVKLFELDRAEVTRTADGWTVRYIRHVAMRPVETVWAALAGADALALGQHPPAAFVAGGVEAGTVTAVDAQMLVEFDAGAGRVRWAFLSDPGGARIELTRTGAHDVEPDPDAWRAHIEALVARIVASSG